jgi:hypothetical protein
LCCAFFLRSWGALLIIPMEFFQEMDLLQKIFWFTAIPVSVIFLIQGIMTFAGLDAADGLDADFDGDLTSTEAPFQLFSFRNLINFLLGFSWTGIACYNTFGNKNIIVLLALLVGAMFVALFFIIIRQITKLAEDNSFRIGNALNKTAQVYLAIPAHKTGKGKIHVSVKGTMHELDAITESERIETGALVKVTGIEHNNLIIVSKI